MCGLPSRSVTSFPKMNAPGLGDEFRRNPDAVVLVTDLSLVKPITVDGEEQDELLLSGNDPLIRTSSTESMSLYALVK